MNILLTNQTSLHNLGDEVILIETLRLLERAFPGARVALTFHQLAGAREALPGHALHPAFESWAHHVAADGSERIAPAWRRIADLARLLLVALSYRVAGRAPALFRDPAKQALLDELAAADLVLVCGGGYLYDTPREQGIIGRLVTLLLWGIFPLLAALLAVLMGKPLAMLPLSIGPLHDGPTRRLAAWVVRRARLTLVRERRSLALLEQLGCTARALAVPDLAFGFPTRAEHAGLARALLARAGLPEPRPAPCVGLTAIDWGAQNPAFARQASYERALVGCIDAVAARGGHVVLFAHSVTRVGAWDDRRVNERLRAAARHPERVTLVHEQCPPEVIQAAYGQLDALVGTRMHSLILALNAGTPVVAIGSLHKTRGVLGEIGLEDRCFDIGAVTAEDLVRALDEALEDPRAAQVDAYLALARRARLSVANMLAAVALVSPHA